MDEKKEEWMGNDRGKVEEQEGIRELYCEFSN